MARTVSSGSRRGAKKSSGGKAASRTRTAATPKPTPKPKSKTSPKASRTPSKTSATNAPKKATAKTAAAKKPAPKTPAPKTPAPKKSAAKKPAAKKPAPKSGGTTPRASGPSAAERFYDAKQKALENLLGPMDQSVYHAIVPFSMGGSLDLYTFSNAIPGTVFVTQELIGPGKQDRTARGPKGFYELAMCRKANAAQDEAGLNLVSRLLNPVAQHAFSTPLGPGETAALPGEDDDGPPQFVLFTEFNPRGVPFAVGDETFILLCVITIFESEFAFIKKHGVAPFLDKLKAAGEYPYSTLERAAVV
jgi:hypothetical protein